MKRQNSFVSILFVFAIFFITTLGCKFTSSTSTTTPNSEENVTSPSPNKEKASNSVSTTPVAAKDIAGNYEASGTNVNGEGAYKGNLTVTKRGEVYQFSWDVGGSKYDGVGVQTDNSIGVSYTSGTDGKGCGVALYKINPDGSLDGKAGYWGNDNSENEKATRTNGTELAGNYDVTGTDPSGKEYKTKLNITPSGPGFIFKWSGSNPLEGVGIQQGNFVTAGFGGKQCAFVAYEIKPDGSLDGKWGGLGTVTFGSEKALKK